MDLTQISQNEFDNQEALVIAALRARYPELDLRRGTAIRDLVVRPNSALSAAMSANITAVQELLTPDGFTDDSNPDTVDAWLASYGVTRLPGFKARGRLGFEVQHRREFNIPAGTRCTVAGLGFVTTTAYTGNPESVLVLELEAESPGSQYNVLSSTSGQLNTPIWGLGPGVTLSDFTGGSDSETNTEAVARLPVAMSRQALDTRMAISSVLSQEFGVLSTGCQGFGDPQMHRALDPVYGFQRPGVVDLWVRTYSNPQRFSATARATRASDGSYTLEYQAQQISGWQAVLTVRDADSGASYDFSSELVPETVDNHFMTANSDWFNTVYSGCRLSVTGIPSTQSTIWLTTEFYRPLLLDQIQEYLDNSATRSLGSDILVRAPVVARTSITGLSPVLLDHAITAINAVGFRSGLRRSDILASWTGFSGLDLGPTGFNLSARIYDYQSFDVSGDYLGFNSGSKFYAGRETTVFTAEAGDAS
jgi:hypothetical protein